MRYIRYFLTGMTALFVLSGCGGPSRSDSLVVIDAGHGGHDCGAQCDGKQEKELVLQITQQLAKEFKRKGYRVYLTRGRDKFLKLGERTKIADKMDAKVFISIHANAIANKNRFEAVEGIETYFLQKTRDARSQRVAARENAAVLQGTDKLSRDVIIDAVLNGPKIVESNKLAIDVQNGMMRQIQSRYKDAINGGVRPAPFYVLVGASRPSILVEVGYITNSKERERLFKPDYQKRIAKGIVEGVSRYLDNRKAETGV
ncbi:N-acetylmuramoyl-L-alanine amidase family protein [Sulfurovum riftiae]|uniref:N-acetylmuramoyl-L-alanine amidase n=1 Tax=Sulfurovum riftiae TaxID=1630136 RepID=A0A151CJI3_9BACT|nr:N-acetylmuramoyl-L-alanine amidase [Sulfurovum riftiae]KYJ87423.1 N-acetylmuramoyl-L-alanine amidase [Sulfurovum riftiae]